MSSEYKISIHPNPKGSILLWSWTLYRNGSPLKAGQTATRDGAKAEAQSLADDLARIEAGTETYDYTPRTPATPDHWKV